MRPQIPDQERLMSFTVDVNVAVPMHDGTTLATDIWRPTDAESVPVLLVRSPYGKSESAGTMVYGAPNILSLLAAGYAVAMQDCRGMFASGGTFVPHADEASDGADTDPWFEDFCKPFLEARRPIQHRLGSIVEDGALDLTVRSHSEIFDIAADYADLRIGSLCLTLLPDRENDGRRGQGYDPGRSHFFSNAQSGYSSVFGRRDTYQQAYRDGFLRGYEEGYQRYDVYFIGGRFHR